ncbi:MAG: hypothetical protein RL172_2477 [Bacteroidota bacterium]
MKKRFHYIGDSHCSFFLGYNGIPPVYPHVAKSLLPGFFCYRLGAPLAYHINHYGANSQAREKLDAIVNTCNPDNDILVLCFGEIDCRAHILKQAALQQKQPEAIIQNCISHYMQAIQFYINKGFTVLVWNAVYSANYEEKNTNLEYPYFGSYQQRNAVTTNFNQQLKQQLQTTAAKFIDISGHLLDANTGLTAEQYYFDAVHLNNRLFLTAVDAINKLHKSPPISQQQVLRYQFNLRMYTVGNFLKTMPAIVKKYLSRLTAG